MSVTLQAAVQHGKDYSENLHSIKNQPKRTLKHLLKVTEKLIKDQTGIPVIKWQQPMWQGTALLIDKAVLFATAKTCVFSDSVLWMWGNSSDSVKAWKGEDYLVYEFMWIQRIWSNPTESRWSSSGKISQNSLPLQILAEIQKKMTEMKCETWAIPMSMYNDIVWWEKKETEKFVLRIISWLLIMLENSRKDICRFLGLDQKTSGTELTHTNRMESGIMSLILWWLISVKVDIPYSVDPVFLKEEIWRAKEKEKFPYISMAATKPSMWFFVQLFPSISSVSTEQWRICVEKWSGKFPNVRRVRRNP